MTALVVHHKVEDYDKWYPVYTQDAVNRKAFGSKGARLFRSKSDPNDLVIIYLGWDLEDAQRFTQSPGLREAMQKAGVIGMPEIFFLEEIEETPA